MLPTNQCQEMELLIQADIDGELSAADAAIVVVHRLQCEHCAQVYAQLFELKNSLRQALMQYAPAADFRATLEARIAQELKLSSQPSVLPINIKVRAQRRVISALGAGALLAASAALFLVTPKPSMLVDAVVAEHIRALQPGHLLDVISSDQHNVKPWFDGKLDFSPPVRDFTEHGFVLEGGRLDYLAGRSVAALIYRHGKHPINVFVWPNADKKLDSSDSNLLVRNGYNVRHWQQDNMAFWVVSDLNENELGEFVKLWTR